jgi:CspA family cold shock protein
MSVTRGQVVRFDQVKGYGFIAPEAGGEDVFLHVNDLLDPKYLIRPGVQVDYVEEQGDRGLKASSVQVVGSAAAANGRAAGPEPTKLAEDDDYVDVISEENFSREVTEILLAADPELKAAQIKAIRLAFANLGKRYGWVVARVDR